MADERFRIGLTGGIASGKSTVANLLGELGAIVIDTDVIAREVVEPGMPALAEIRETFGNDIVDESGALDRRALRQRVFADDEARSTLELILHPRIRAETLRQSANAEGPYQLIVVPLLVGSELVDAMDRILVVDCTEETQLRRLLERDAESETQARAILAAQASREERLAIADDVIVNDGTLKDLERSTRDMHRKYLDLAGIGR